MPDIIALTRDDIEHRFTCAPSAFVLDAAEAAGLYLPSVCRHGRCGTCWAQVVSGAYELAPFEAKAKPAAAHGVLLCRCRPKQDMVIKLPCRDAQIGRAQVPERQARVEAVTQEAGWVNAVLRLAPAGEHGAAADFAAGQYMEMKLPGSAVWPPVFMANLANEEGRLEFLLPPEHAAARALATARHGDRLDLRGPLGRFALDETSPRPRCLAGAGAGAAAIMALLARLAAQRDRTRLHVLFELPAAAQPVMMRRLAGLRAALPQLSAEFVAQDAAGALRAVLAKLPQPDVYACGPAAFLAGLAAMARAAGLPEAQLHCETAAGLAEEAVGLTGT